MRFGSALALASVANAINLEHIIDHDDNGADGAVDAGEVAEQRCECL